MASWPLYIHTHEGSPFRGSCEVDIYKALLNLYIWQPHKLRKRKGCSYTWPIDKLLHLGCGREMGVAWFLASIKGMKLTVFLFSIQGFWVLPYTLLEILGMGGLHIKGVWGKDAWHLCSYDMKIHGNTLQFLMIIVSSWEGGRSTILRTYNIDTYIYTKFDPNTIHVDW